MESDYTRDRYLEWHYRKMRDIGLSCPAAKDSAISLTAEKLDVPYKVVKDAACGVDIDVFLQFSKDEVLSYDSSEEFAESKSSKVTEEEIQEHTDSEEAKHSEDQPSVDNKEIEVGGEEDEEESLSRQSAKDLYMDKEYIYDEEEGKYIVFLSSHPKPLVIDEDLHEEIIQAYSNWVGTTHTIEEVVQKFSFFTRESFNEYRKLFDLTHDNEPFPKEKVIEEDSEDLAEQIYQENKYELAQKTKQKERKKNNKAAKKWNNFEVSIVEPLSQIVPDTISNREPPKIKMNESERPFSVVANFFDIHLGKDGWADQTGEGYNIEQTKQRSQQKTERIISKVNNRGRPEKIFFILGGDLFDIDNMDQQTTSGTNVDTDGVPPEIIDEGIDLAINVIDMYRQVAPVHIMITPGNHDEMLSHTLINLIKAHYNSADDVQINTGSQNHKYRVYKKYGNTLIGVSHGRDERRSDLAEIMAHENRKTWGETEHSVFFVGDKHTEKTTQSDVSGTVVYQVPSISGKSTWDHKKGYIKRSALSAYVIDKQRGVDAVEYAVHGSP